MSAPETLRVTVRLFVDARLIEEETHEVNSDETESFVNALVERHGPVYESDQPILVEFEFLDEPDPLQRFVRLGTDPRGMVMPLPLSPPNPGTVH